MSLLSDESQVSFPYKVTDKTILLYILNFRFLFSINWIYFNSGHLTSFLKSFLYLTRWNISDTALGTWWDIQFPVSDAPQHPGRPFIQWSYAIPSFPMDSGWLWIRRTGSFTPCYIPGFLPPYGCPEPRKAWAVQEKVSCISRDIYVYLEFFYGCCLSLSYLHFLLFSQFSFSTSLAFGVT